ncbi:MAG: hypothetical protein Q9202_006271 [Teloschistes flavicans]
MLDRDLRSSSVPRLRHASKRAKYGRALPPIDAFYIDTSASLWTPQLGKPITHLTSSQKHRIARDSAPGLIGKHVNRNNQRTGERDPWNHYGAGKRWAKQEAKGKDMDTLAGIAIWRGQQDDDRWLEFLLERQEEAINQEPDSAVSDLNEAGHFKPVQFMQGNDDNEPGEINTGHREQIHHQRPQLEHGWEFVESVEDHGGTACNDDWDVVSLHSAPG